jgi:SAM-dependent methyltransferase
VWLLHLVDARAVLEEVARVLRPGGRYLVVPVNVTRPDDPPVRRLTDDMGRRLRGGTGSPDAPDRVVALAESLPFRSLGVVEGEPQVLTTTAQRTASFLEQRLWFILQDVTDEVWEAVVAPTIAALRALPGQEEVVSYEIRPRVLMLERTGCPD